MVTTESGRHDSRIDDISALRSIGPSQALWRVQDAGWQPRIAPAPQGLLSGAFNPRHAGHDGLRDAAEDWIGGPVYFELALTNADKPALTVDEAAVRCRQFPDDPLLVTRTATFVEKARIVPGVTFVVGADTAVRVVDSRFYGVGDDTSRAGAAMLRGLDELRQLGCRFLVAARSLRGQTLRLPDVPVPDRFVELFTELPEADFRCDVSSSDLRETADS